MLDDRRRRALELATRRRRRLEVEQIVVRELAAAELLGRHEARARTLGVRVDRGLLVRVLPVAQIGRLAEGSHVKVREAPSAAEPLLDRGVVHRGVGVRGDRELATRRLAHRPAAFPHLGKHLPVLIRAGEHRHAREVLRRRADHARAADVDLLDSLLERHVGARHRLPERIQVHADDIDRADVVLVERRHVGRIVPAREDATMDIRVQRLHAPVEDLGEPGDGADANDLEAGLLEHRSGAARRYDLVAGLGESAREIRDSCLVRDADERPAWSHFDLVVRSQRRYASINGSRFPSSTP